MKKLLATCNQFGSMYLMTTGQLVRVFNSRGIFLRISQIEQVRTTKTGAVELKCFRCGWVALENVLPLRSEMN